MPQMLAAWSSRITLFLTRERTRPSTLERRLSQRSITIYFRLEPPGVRDGSQGFRHGPADVLARVSAGDEVGRDEYYFRLTVKLETNDPGLEWMNRTVFVASAGRNQMSVVYDLFALR